MRVAVLTQWYPPEPIRLAYELAESLVTMGHAVDVVTGFPNFPFGTLYSGYRLRPWQRDAQNGVRVTRVWLYPDHSRSKLRRVANYLSFALSAGFLGPFLLRRPDVIYVYGSPYTTALAAAWWRVVWRRPIVFHVLDMWPEGLAATGMVRGRVLGAMAGFAKAVYRLSSQIIASTPGFGRNLVEKGVPAAKTVVVHNWVDPDLYRPVPADAREVEELGLAGRFMVMYAGAIGPPQGLDVVLDAAELLRDAADVRFVLVGDGVDRERLSLEAENRRLDNVQFLGLRPSEAMPQLLAAADVLLVHLRDEEIFRMTIPHKIFAYMGAAKPILCGVAGDAASVVEDAKAGLTFTPGSASEMAAAVRRVQALSPQRRQEMGASGRRSVIEKYSRTRIVSEIESVLRRACNTGAR